MTNDENINLKVLLEGVIHKSNAQSKVLKKMLNQLEENGIQINENTVAKNNDKKDKFKKHK